MFYLSIHGGNSNFDVIAFNENCEILGRGHRSGIDNCFEPQQTVLRHISEAVIECVVDLYSLGFSGRFECVYYCMVAKSNLLKECFLQIGYDIGEYIFLEEPFCYLLAGGLTETGGVALASTGSCAAFCSGRNDLLITGGYGIPVGDEGSSAYIGIRGINMVTRAIGGWGEKTILYDFLCESLGNNTAHVDTVRLLQLLYPENNYARRLIYVKFAQQVVRAAGCGDAVAVSILEEAGELMARQTLCAYRLYLSGARGTQNDICMNHRGREQGIVDLSFDRSAHGNQTPGVYVCGSTWKNNPIMLNAFQSFVSRCLPEARCIETKRAAVYGGFVCFLLETYGNSALKEAAVQLDALQEA